jgi:hypothetical protein
MREKDEEKDDDKKRQTGKETDKWRIEEDKDRDPWSLLGDLYTRETRFKAESELSNESRTLVQLS